MLKKLAKPPATADGLTAGTKRQPIEADKRGNRKQEGAHWSGRGKRLVIRVEDAEDAVTKGNSTLLPFADDRTRIRAFLLGAITPLRGWLARARLVQAV